MKHWHPTLGSSPGLSVFWAVEVILWSKHSSNRTTKESHGNHTPSSWAQQLRNTAGESTFCFFWGYISIDSDMPDWFRYQLRIIVMGVWHWMTNENLRKRLPPWIIAL